MIYRIVVSKSAQKEIDNLQLKYIKKIEAILRKIALEPFKGKKLRNSINTTSMKGVLLRNNLTNSNSSIKRYSIHINN